MLNKDEILERLGNSTTWRQSGVTMEDVKVALTAESESESQNSVVAELQARVNNLTETNKRLKAENKALKGR